MSARIGMHNLRALCCCVLLWVLTGCGDTNKHNPLLEEDTIKLTDNKGSSTSIIPSNGGQLLLKVNASNNWKIELSNNSFASISKQNGAKGEHAIILTIAKNEGEERKEVLTASLSSSRGAIVSNYTLIQQGAKGNNHSQYGNEVILGDVTLMELPRLSANGNDYFVTHYVENGEQVNYSLEYNVEARHARWVCFSFDTKINKIKTKRSEAWGWDPLIPSKYEVVRNDFEKKFFARGHLVASFDRVFSAEANQQTFYYTNMSPQRHAFNEGIWQQMEQIVQAWGRKLSANDILYVAKGGTINSNQIENKRSADKIVVPKYYWMALLKKENNGWSSMAFLVEHEKPQRATRLLPYAISIAELEAFTGLDFFFNLPDDIEHDIERQQPKDNITSWPGL